MASLGKPTGCTLFVVSRYQVMTVFKCPTVASRFNGGKFCACAVFKKATRPKNAAAHSQARFRDKLAQIFMHMYCRRCSATFKNRDDTLDTPRKGKVTGA